MPNYSIEVPTIDSDRIRNGDPRAMGDALLAFQKTLGQIATAIAVPRIGKWKDELYDASHFTQGAGGTWTVIEADVIRNRYIIIDQMLVWDVAISDSLIAGTPDLLKIALPAGLKGFGPNAGGAGTAQGGVAWFASGAALSGIGGVQLVAADRFAYFLRTDPWATPWPTEATGFALQFVAIMDVAPLALGL